MCTLPVLRQFPKFNVSFNNLRKQTFELSSGRDMVQRSVVGCWLLSVQYCSGLAVEHNKHTLSSLTWWGLGAWHPVSPAGLFHKTFLPLFQKAPLVHRFRPPRLFPLEATMCWIPQCQYLYHSLNYKVFMPTIQLSEFKMRIFFPNLLRCRKCSFVNNFVCCPDGFRQDIRMNAPTCISYIDLLVPSRMAVNCRGGAADGVKECNRYLSPLHQCPVTLHCKTLGNTWLTECGTVMGMGPVGYAVRPDWSSHVETGCKRCRIKCKWLWGPFLCICD